MNISFVKQYLNYMNQDSAVLKELKELMSGVEVSNPTTEFNDEVLKQVHDFLLSRSISDKDSFEVSIVTWENDGDDYSTQVVNVPNIEVLNQLLYVLEAFSATNEDLGNEDYDPYTFASTLVCGIEENHLTREFVKEFFAIDIPEFDTFEELELWTEMNFSDDGLETLSCIHELLGSPVSYDHDFCRVVDTVVVKNAVSLHTIKKFNGNNWNNPEVNWSL